MDMIIIVNILFCAVLTIKKVLPLIDLVFFANVTQLCCSYKFIYRTNKFGVFRAINSHYCGQPSMPINVKYLDVLVHEMKITFVCKQKAPVLQFLV